MATRMRDLGTITWVGSTDAQIEFGNVEQKPVFVAREDLEKSGINPVRAGLIISAIVSLDATSVGDVMPDEFQSMPQPAEGDNLNSLAAE